MFLRKVCKSQRNSTIAVNSIIGVVALLSLVGCGTDSPEQISQVDVAETAGTSTPEIPEIHLNSEHDSESVHSSKEVDLLALVNIEDCRISGNWTIEEQLIVSPKGNGLKLQIP